MNPFAQVPPRGRKSYGVVHAAIRVAVRWQRLRTPASPRKDGASKESTVFALTVQGHAAVSARVRAQPENMRERRGILQELTDATDYGDRTNIDKKHRSPVLSGPEDDLVLPESAWL